MNGTRYVTMMKMNFVKWLVVILFFTLLTGLQADLWRPSRYPIPKRFNAYIGGFLGPSYQIELQEGVLIYTTFDPGRQNPQKIEVKPTIAEWQEFRKALDLLKVWRWRKDYPPTAHDGTDWSLEIEYFDQSLKTRGSNNYPETNGKPNGTPEPTETFANYLSAIEVLLGGRTFR